MRVDTPMQDIPLQDVQTGHYASVRKPMWAILSDRKGDDAQAEKALDNAYNISAEFLNEDYSFDDKTAFDLPKAVLGEQIVKKAIADRATEELVMIESIIAEAIRGDASSSFQRPDIKFVSNGDILNSTERFVLPDGVNGAFVPGTNGEPGTILLSDDLKFQPGKLMDVALEELGEALADHLSTMNFEIAAGDAGHRLMKVFRGEELTSDDFLINQTGLDEQVIRFNHDPTVLAKTNAMEDLLGDLTPASVQPDDPESGAYITSQLTEADLEFYTNAVLGADFTDSDLIWATSLVTALNAVGATTATLGEVRDLLRIVDPSNIDNHNPDSDIGGQFTRDQVKALIQSGAIQFHDTAIANAPSRAYIDFSKMDVYTPPDAAEGAGYDMADILTTNYIPQGDLLSLYNLDNFMKEFFGLDIGAVSPMDHSGLTVEEGAPTIQRAFRAYVSDNGGELNNANSYLNPDVELIRGFLGDDTQSEFSILIAKDSASEVAGYDWALKSRAGGTVDPVDDPDDIVPTLTNYSIEDIQQPSNPYFDDKARIDGWVTAMNAQAGAYETAITNYKDEVTNLVTTATLPTGSADEALAGYSVFLQTTVEQLNLITTEASTAGQKSTLRMETNGFVYEEPTFVSEGVRIEMENAAVVMQAKGKALAATLADLSKQLTAIVASEHGTIYAAEKRAELDMILGFLTMALDTTAVMSGAATLGKGSLGAFQKKQAAKLGKLPQQEKENVAEFAEAMQDLPNSRILTTADKARLQSAIIAGKVYDNSHEKVFDVVRYGLMGLGTTSFGISQTYIGIKRVAAVAEYAAAQAGIEMPPYLTQLLTSLSGEETDEALNFYSDMASAGFQGELDAFSAGYSVASLATDWAGNDIALVTTLQSLNKTDGNKTESLDDGWKISESISLYEMTDETYLLRDLGYKVSRGGQYLGNVMGIAPWADDPNYDFSFDNVRTRVEWVQDRIDENDIQWALDQGWELYETGSTEEWASTDVNFSTVFQVADGAERVGFIKVGGVNTGGIGFNSGDLRNLGEHDDDVDEALGDLYAAAGVNEGDMEYI